MRRDGHWLIRLLSDGTDPDPRFSLANERTFLAWVRTGLALIALGIAVATFVSTSGTKGASALLSLGLIALGGILSSTAWLRWLQVERGMRLNRGIPPTTLGLVLAVGVGVLAVVAIMAVVIGA
jgi:putative membrane protein